MPALPEIAIALLATSILLWIAWRLMLPRHEKQSPMPQPKSWTKIIEGNLPLAEKLSKVQRDRLFAYMQIFLKKKHFEGCGGLELTEEIKVTVAAQACILLIGRDAAQVYPRLKSILIYPHAYQSGQQGFFGGNNGSHVRLGGSWSRGVVVSGPNIRLGESWSSGVVVLAWDSVLGGARNIEDGHNVTFHEFAHQLDQEDGVADGAPILDHRSAYRAWARVFQHEYDELVNETQRGQKSILDQYGATNPAEFFAVATEAFFEKPRQLKATHSALYEELQSYYHVDPIDWIKH